MQLSAGPVWAPQGLECPPLKASPTAATPTLGSTPPRATTPRRSCHSAALTAAAAAASSAAAAAAQAAAVAAAVVAAMDREGGGSWEEAGEWVAGEEAAEGWEVVGQPMADWVALPHPSHVAATLQDGHNVQLPAMFLVPRRLTSGATEQTRSPAATRSPGTPVPEPGDGGCRHATPPCRAADWWNVVSPKVPPTQEPRDAWWASPLDQLVKVGELRGSDLPGSGAPISTPPRPRALLSSHPVAAHFDSDADSD
ncbi:hypothetical protein V8C86DRAFT_2796572 [Haematococcus lacustris]